MAAHEARSPRQEPFRLFHQGPFHTADVTHDRARFQAAPPGFQVPLVAIHRCGQNYQVGAADALLSIGHITVDGAELDRRL